MREATEVIIRPIITEKSVDLRRQGKYVLEVAKDATKIDVRAAIEKLGGCEVESVNTLNVKGRLRRTRRGQGRTRSWKKAIVTLRPDQEMGGVLGEAFEIG